jgi:hypothetical protein
MTLISRNWIDGRFARDAAMPGDPSYQALLLLHVVFAVAPVLFGLDKFAQWLVDWDRYLAPEIVDALPGTAHELMYVVGPSRSSPAWSSRCAPASADTWWPGGWPPSS